MFFEGDVNSSTDILILLWLSVKSYSSFLRVSTYILKLLDSVGKSNIVGLEFGNDSSIVGLVFLELGKASENVLKLCGIHCV